MLLFSKILLIYFREKERGEEQVERKRDKQTVQSAEPEAGFNARTLIS